MTRRHWVGEQIEVDRMKFRIRDGTKPRPSGVEDHVLELLGPEGFSPVTFALPFVIMDVLGQNEDALYPEGAGGSYLFRALLMAYKEGWGPAWVKLQEQRARREERREQGEL